MNMNFQGIDPASIAGDAHFFEDTTSPAKVRQYLDSSKVSQIHLHIHIYNLII